MTKNKPAPVQGTMAMWICTPFGIIMPAAVPPEVAAKLPADSIQVRARAREHLDRLRELYLPELGPTVDTKSMDYDCRAYCLKEQLAVALCRMALDIDACKFKPLTAGPKGLKNQALAARLHGVYNGCWGVVTKLSDKPWATGKNTVISKPDPNASREICQLEGHAFPASNGGGRVRVVHCSDCDALKNTYTGKVYYPKNHKVWAPAGTTVDAADVMHLPQPGSKAADEFISHLADQS